MKPLSEIAAFTLSYEYPATQLKDHVFARSRAAFAKGDAARDAITAPEAVRQRQTALREFVIRSVGGLPPMDTPLNARTTRTTQGDGYTVEAVIYESRPRHYVTASLYLPAGRSGPCPAILFLCGHSADGRLFARYQEVCQTLVKAGFIVLAQDPVGQGERSSYYDPETGDFRINRAVADHQSAGMQCRMVGDNIARYFIHDGMRSIDYLLTRPEVDPERIGLTGNSGGGTQCSLLMMTDPRIAAAAPGTFIMTRESYLPTGQGQDAEQIWAGFSGAGYDHEDILLAMAPRPVCVLAVQYDFFPIEGARRSVSRARRFWEVLGSDPARMEICEDAAVHGYTPVLAHGAARFFTRHFFGRELETAPLPTAAVPAETLWATRTGQVRAEFADAEFPFDANLARVREAAARRAALPPAERRERAVRWLRERVFAHREETPLNPRLIRQRAGFRNLDLDIAFWHVQPGLSNLGMLFRPYERKPRGVTIALWDGGSRALGDHSDWLTRECGADRAVLVLNLSGIGAMAAASVNPGEMEESYGTFNRLADDLIWLGDSLPALRTYEFLRVLEVLPLWPELNPDDVRVYAVGRAGLYARLAAALEPRLACHEWVGTFTYTELATQRYYNSYGLAPRLLPGALEYFDLDEFTPTGPGSASGPTE